MTPALRLHPAYEHQDELRSLLPEVGMFYLVLYTLDRYGLTEHGGSIGGAWLTPKGEAVRDALAREEDDAFEALLSEHCACGYDLDDQSHDCFANDGEVS